TKCIAGGPGDDAGWDCGSLSLFVISKNFGGATSTSTSSRFRNALHPPICSILTSLEASSFQGHNVGQTGCKGGHIGRETCIPIQGERIDAMISSMPLTLDCRNTQSNQLVSGLGYIASLPLTLIAQVVCP